jgi:hypothetical protein
MNAILSSDGKLASELMSRHINLLSNEISDLLQFLRARGNGILFAESI